MELQALHPAAWTKSTTWPSLGCQPLLGSGLAVRVGVVAPVAVAVVVAVGEVVVPTESASVPWRVGRTRSRHHALATAGYLPSHPTSPSRFLCTLWWRLW